MGKVALGDLDAVVICYWLNLAWALACGDMIQRCLEARLAEPMFSVSDGFTTTLWRKVVASTPEVPPKSPMK